MVVKILVVFGFCILLSVICFLNTGTDQKNMIGFRSYPVEVQRLVREDPVLKKMAPKEINMVKVLISNIILFTVLFVVTGIMLKRTVGFKNDFDTFVYFLILGQIINLFDLVIIDLLWWRNTTRIRFSTIPDKALYQDPHVHIASFLRGIIMYLGVAIIVTGVLMIF